MEYSYSFYWKSGYTYDERVNDTFGADLPKDIEGRILDVGCSIGDTTYELSRLYPNAVLYGVDVNIDRVIEARKKYPHLDFLYGDGYDIGSFTDLMFDAIFCMNNIAFKTRFFDDGVLKELFEKYFSAISEGGYFVMSRDDEYFILKRYEEGVEFVRAEMNGVGLKIEFDRIQRVLDLDFRFL